jgi:hypothetical protein
VVAAQRDLYHENPVNHAVNVSAMPVHVMTRKCGGIFHSVSFRSRGMHPPCTVGTTGNPHVCIDINEFVLNPASSNTLKAAAPARL